MVAGLTGPDAAVLPPPAGGADDNGGVAPPQLRVRVLGGLAVDGVDEQALGSRKGRTLLKLLVLARGRPVPVDRLVEALWGERPPASPADQVAVLVSRLRRVVGPDRVVRTDAGYSLLVDWLDLDELEARVDEARGALGSGRVTVARAAADASVRLARGDVLPDEDGDWVDAARARAGSVAREARRLVAESAAAAGDQTGAAAAAELALADDPYDEAALRILMRAHRSLGRPASALAAYGRVKERLVDDLGVSPTQETEELHDEIVLAPSASAHQVEAIARSVTTTMPRPTGRAPEMALLDERLERCVADRRAGCVVLVGEAGMGKTTVVDGWTASVRNRVVVLAGRARAAARDLPLQAVLDALTNHLAGVGPEERGELLGPDSAVLAPILGVDGSGPATAAGTTVLTDAEGERARLFTALRAVVGRLAARTPVVLVVDDLHHAGPSTLAWLDHASALAAPVLLVATTRPPVDGLPADATVVDLGPLDVDAVAELVGEERAAEVHARTGGTPLLIAALGHDPGAASGPVTLEDAVSRRAGALLDGESTVRTAAVLGADVDVDLVAAVTRLPATTILDHLERGVAAGLLVERGAGFSFRHDLERDVLAGATGGARRALLHRDAARALALRPAPDPAAVAEHARLGGDTDLAVTWYLRAADLALQRADADAAEAILSTALDLHDSPTVRAARARARLLGGHLDDAAVDAELAAATADPAALELAGWVAYYRRRYDEARAYADDALRRATDPALRISCLALSGRVRHGTGDVEGALDALETAVAAHDAPADVGALARVWLALVRVHEGRPAEALDALPAVVPSGSHPFAPLHARFGRIMALGQTGHVAAALAACDDADAVLARSGAVGTRFRPVVANCRGWLLRWSGRPDDADTANAWAVEASAGTEMTEPRYAGVLDLADGRLLAGDTDGALALAGSIADIEHWHGTMAWHQRHRYGLLRARLALAAGDRDEAATLATDVADDAAARGAGRYEALGRGVAALSRPADAEFEIVADAVAVLGRTAVLDGWWLVDALAAAFDVAEWADAADRAVAHVVRSSPHPERTRELVDRLRSPSSPLRPSS